MGDRPISWAAWGGYLQQGHWLLGRDGNSRRKLQNNSGDLKCVGRGACTSVLQAQQEWTFPDKAYGYRISLVTSCLGGLFGCGCVWEWWVPGTGSHHHSKLPGLQPAPRPLQEIPWGKGAARKVGDWVILVAWLSLGWLVPQEICGWVGTYSGTCVCAANKTSVVYVPSKSDASSTSTCVGLVGWVGTVSWVASPSPK